MKKYLLLFVCLIISSCCLIFAFSKADWPVFLSNLTYFRTPTVLLSVILYLFGFYPRALRWKLMLLGVKRITIVQSWRMIVIGYAANNLLPFRLGELVRVELTRRETGIPRLTCLSSVVAERILDGLIIVFFLIISSWFLFGELNNADCEAHRILVLGLLIFSGATIAIISLSLFSNSIKKLASVIFGKKGIAFAEKYLNALHFFKDLSRTIQIIILSLLIWGLESSMFIVLIRDLGSPHPVATGFYCMAIVNLGILVPSAPGYIGVFQAATVLAFISLGLPGNSGLAFSVVLHVSQFLPITVMGVFLLARMGLDFSNLMKLQRYRDDN